MGTKSILLALALAMAPAVAVPGAAAVEPAAPAAQPAAEPWSYPRWSQMTPEGMVAQMQAAVRESAAAVDSICALEPQEMTFENTFRAYDRADSLVFLLDARCNALAFATGDPQLQEGRSRVMQLTVGYRSGLVANTRLWAALKAAAAQPWVQQLSPARQRYVQQVLDFFRSNGADLSPEVKERKAQIAARLAELGQEFERRMAASPGMWYHVFTDAAALAGMPAGWLADRAAEARENGFGTEAQPQYLVLAEDAMTILSNCTCEETRKLVWQGAMRDRCCSGAQDTAPVVAEILELRRELAELLGFRNYADYAAANSMNSMLTDGDRALAFINGLLEQLRPLYREQLQQLLDYISARKGRVETQLNPWDFYYYYGEFTDRNRSVPLDSYLPYYEVGQVHRAMFDLAGELYGIRIVRVPSACPQPGQQPAPGVAETWHPDVELYAVHDAKTGAHLASFYLDVKPRSGKREGAWTQPLSYSAVAADGTHAPQLTAVVAGLRTVQGGGKEFYTPQAVAILFHEFGHVLHSSLSACEVVAQSGMLVSRDFCELPSMLTEEWVWQPQVLRRYARHAFTGEPMPEEYISALCGNRRFLAALDAVEMLGVAKLDLEMHMHYAEKFRGRDLDAASAAVLGDDVLFHTGRSPVRTLSHSMASGYGAQLYSYKWADVMVADAFSRFTGQGGIDTSAGAAFRACILSKGDSKPAAQLFRDFMGREPRPAAWLRSLGVRTEPAE